MGDFGAFRTVLCASSRLPGRISYNPVVEDDPVVCRAVDRTEMRSMALGWHLTTRLHQMNGMWTRSLKIFRDYFRDYTSNQTVMLQSDDRHVEAPSQENRDD
ncbi:hypothetical protein [Caballeronia sp. KNU42]